MGGCASKDQAQARAPHRLNERQSLENISELYKKAFGKTSALSREDIDFFLPDTGPLNPESYRSRLVTSNGTQTLKLPHSGVSIRYAHVSQRGYYPDNMEKPNQDALLVKTEVAHEPDSVFLGVFDGHGSAGTECAQFAKEKVILNLISDPDYYADPCTALEKSMIKTNQQMHAAHVDDTLSGTTAVGVLMKGKQLYIANVGDSRCIIAEREGDALKAVDLTLDQTPFRKDEMERVKLYGARVMTLEQLDGLKDPSIQEWGTEEEDSGDPPRLWHPEGSYPGTAFTRSLGDGVAEEIGVVGHPEMTTVMVTEKHAFMVIATDGVWEFLSSQTVIDIVEKYEPQEACLALAVESYKAWLSTESRTDDISVIVVHFELGTGLTAMKRVGSEPLQTESRTSSMPANVNRLLSVKSMRKGLARGSMAMVNAPVGLAGDHAAAAQQSASANGRDTSAEDFMESGGTKSQEEEAYLRALLEDHPRFMRLPPATLTALLDLFVLRFVDEGEVVIKQGQPGEHFFVVKEGTFALRVLQAGEGSHPGTLQTVKRFAPGSDGDSCFGEIALVVGSTPYGGNIVARSAGQVWQLDRRAYKQIVAGGTPRVTIDGARVDAAP